MSLRHNHITVIAPIERRRAKLVTWLRRNIGYQCATPSMKARLAGIPTLHFLSAFTFDMAGDGSNPAGYLVLEASFDGPVEDFLHLFTRRCHRMLVHIFAHCQKSKGVSPLEYIRRHNRKVDCFYVSCPGLSRPQIDEERRLVNHLRRRNDTLVALGGLAYPDFASVFKRMREGAIARHILKSPVPREPWLVKYGQPIFAALSVLAPMAILALYILALGRWPPLGQLLEHPLLAIAAAAGIAALAKLLATSNPKPFTNAALLLGLVASAVGAATVSYIVPDGTFIAARLALAGIALFLGWIVFGLYRLGELERSDAIDTGWVDVDNMRDVCADENAPGCMQNHFVNVCIVKDGRVRLWTLRIFLWIVHVLGVVYFNRGKLGGIPSIHFARWVIMEGEDFGDQPLLMFSTNYDASWDSYLGDFVDDSSQGVSGIWSNTKGFPRTWALLLGGGSRFEKQFKAYARKGQQRTSAWYTAYPNISVRQKLSNAHVRRILARKPERVTVVEQDDLLRRI